MYITLFKAIQTFNYCLFLFPLYASKILAIHIPAASKLSAAMPINLCSAINLRALFFVNSCKPSSSNISLVLLLINATPPIFAAKKAPKYPTPAPVRPYHTGIITGFQLF